MGVTLGIYLDNTAAGWTTFTESGDTRKVYADSSRPDDSGDGLSPATAKKTLGSLGGSGACSLMRDGFPDWLLLKKGSAFTETLEVCHINGRSATEPMLISSYGTGDRPIIRAPGLFPIQALGGQGDYMAFVGLKIYAWTRDPDGGNFIQADADANGTSGIRYLSTTHWVLIEDCDISFFGNNILFDNGSISSSVIIRRCVNTNAYETNPAVHSGGLYCTAVNYMLIEESIFDANGYNASVTGADPEQFNHNIYYQEQNTGPLILRGSIMSRDSSEIQVRAGGTVQNNFFVQSNQGPNLGQPLNFISDYSDNVYMEGVLRSTPGSVQGTAVFAWYAELPYAFNVGTARIHNNIFAHTTDTASAAISFDPKITNTITITLGPPTHFDYAFLGVPNGHPIVFTNNGDTLPAPLAFNTTYYVVNSGVDSAKSFRLATTPGGADINASGGSQSGTHQARIDDSDVRNNSVFNNIFWDWCSPEVNDLGTNNVVTNNVLHGGSNVNDLGYPDPFRTAGSYYTSIGRPGGFAATTAGFLQAARQQSRDNWNPALTADAVNNYIRAGFGISEGGTQILMPRAML